MIDPNDFQQILWDEWTAGYWVETISQFEPILYLRVGKHLHDDKKNRPQPEGQMQLLTPFVSGEDGFVYKKMLINREEILVPIYTLKKEI